MADAARRSGGGARLARRRGARHGRRGPAAARSRSRRGATTVAGPRPCRGACRARRRGPRRSPVGHAATVGGSDAGGPARALAPGPRPCRRQRADQLLPDLPRLSQPQERRSAPAAGALRPPACRSGPGPVPRPGSGGADARPPGHRIRRACDVGGIHAVLRVHPGYARGSARLLARPAGRPVLHDGTVDQLAAGGGKLLPPAVGGTDLRRARRLRGSAGHRRGAPSGASARPAPAVSVGPGRRHRAEHRGVLVPACLDLLHRRLGGPSAAAGPTHEDRGMAAARDHALVDGLPGVALRRRRRRRPAARGDLGRAGVCADRLQAAPRSTDPRGRAHRT